MNNNQHIENAKQNIATAEDWGITHPEQVSTMALLAIAEALLSIAKSIKEMEADNEEIRRGLDVVPNPNTPEVSKEDLGKICEVCEEHIGVINSRYILDDYHEGVWICATCEQEVEQEYYSLPEVLNE